MDLSVQTSGDYVVDNHDWLGSAHGTQATESITLDTTKFTAGTHAPNGFLPSGTPLGKITASGKYGPYTPAAADGTDVLAGFLFGGVKFDGNQAANVGAALFVHGKVREANLPASALDANGKADVANRIRFI